MRIIFNDLFYFSNSSCFANSSFVNGSTGFNGIVSKIMFIYVYMRAFFPLLHIFHCLSNNITYEKNAKVTIWTIVESL
jgi:hypothetical protein